MNAIRPAFGRVSELFVALAIACALLGCWEARAEQRTIIVFGDSIAAGTGMPEAERAQVWVRRVEQLARGRLRMMNESEGGRWTSSVNEFEAMLARQPRADILVLALGTNDSADLSEEAVARAVRNLSDMVRLARRRYGAELAIVILGPPNIRKDALLRTRAIGTQRERKLRELDAAFAELAARLGCQFLSLYGVVPESSLKSDGMHPDAAGNEYIVKAVLPKLLSIAAPR